MGTVIMESHKNPPPTQGWGFRVRQISKKSRVSRCGALRLVPQPEGRAYWLYVATGRCPTPGTRDTGTGPGLYLVGPSQAGSLLQVFLMKCVNVSTVLWPQLMPPVGNGVGVAVTVRAWGLGELAE